MEVKAILVFVGITLTFLLKESDAKECYACGSLTGISVGEGCLDPFKKGGSGITTSDCTGSCMKSKVEKDGQQLIARACSVIRLDEKCEEQDGVTVCFCNGNLCNPAASVKISTVSIFAAVVGSIIFKLFQ